MDTPALPPMAAPPLQALPVAPVPISVALHVQRIYLNFLGKGKGDNVLPSVPSTELFNDACKVTQAYITGTLVEQPPMTTNARIETNAGEVSAALQKHQPQFTPGNPQPKRDMWGNRGGQPAVPKVPMVTDVWLLQNGAMHGLYNVTESTTEYVARFGTHLVWVNVNGRIKLHRAGGYEIYWIDDGATVEQLLSCLACAQLCGGVSPRPAVSGATG